MDTLRKEVLEQIAKNGRCYSNEAQSMAKELLELRAQEEARQVPTQIPFQFYP